MSNGEPEILMPSGERATGEFVSQPAKLLRIAAMIRELLEEVRKSSLDEAGRKRLRAIYEKALGTLKEGLSEDCLLYTSPSPRDRQKSRMPSSA